MQQKTTPSWVGFENKLDGMVVVGDRARDQDTWIYDAKRMIGREFSDESIQEHLRCHWDFAVGVDIYNRC